MHQAESSSSLFCLWTGRSLPAALHPASRRRSCLPLRTDQCFCPIGTFALLLVRTLRRTPFAPSGRERPYFAGLVTHWVHLDELGIRQDQNAQLNALTLLRSGSVAAYQNGFDRSLRFAFSSVS